MNINGIEITADTIAATRIHFAQIHRRCIADAQSGKVKVNDLCKYVVSQEKRITSAMSGEYDNTLTYLQRALYIQTGEMVPILN